MLSLSIKANRLITFEEALTYSLYTVPLCLVHQEGSMRKLPKNKLVKCVIPDNNIQNEIIIERASLRKKQKKLHVTAQKIKKQETADLVTFTEKTLNGKLHFLCRGAYVLDMMAQIRSCISIVPKTEQFIKIFLSSTQKNFERVDLVAVTFKLEEREKRTHLQR